MAGFSVSLLVLHITITMPMPCPSNNAGMPLSSCAAACPIFVPKMCSFKGFCYAEHEQHAGLLQGLRLW